MGGSYGQWHQRLLIQSTGRTPHPTQGSTPWAPRIAECNGGCKSQDLLHLVSRERGTFGMPDQRTACAPLRVYRVKVKKVKSSWPGASQWRIYYHRMWGHFSTTSSNLLKQSNAELLVAVNHDQLRTMPSETVDPIDWSHPPPSWAVPSECLMHSINQCNLSGNWTCNRSMRGNRLAYVAIQGIPWLNWIWKFN